MQSYLLVELFERFWPRNTLTNRDS